MKNTAKEYAAAYRRNFASQHARKLERLWKWIKHLQYLEQLEGQLDRYQQLSIHARINARSYNFSRNRYRVVLEKYINLCYDEYLDRMDELKAEESMPYIYCFHYPLGYKAKGAKGKSAKHGKFYL